MSGIIGDFGNYSSDYDCVSYIRHILYMWLMKYEKQLEPLIVEYIQAMIKECERNIETNRKQLFETVGGSAVWESIGMIQCFFVLFKTYLPTISELMKWFDSMYIPFTNAFMTLKRNN